MDFSSPYYPYTKVERGRNTLKGAEQIPHKLLVYLLDLPDANHYQPQDDNDRPRVRFIKYVCCTGADPLSEPLPKPAVKRSILFDPDQPVTNDDEQKTRHPLGYRLFWQRIYGQSGTEADVVVTCYLGRIFENRPFITTIGVYFDILVNVNLETNTRTSAYQRSFDIEQCLHEALDGVNMAGIGTLSFSRGEHMDNGSTFLYDESTVVGRRVHCSISWAEGGGAVVSGVCDEC